MPEPELHLIFDGDDPPFEQQSRENGFTSWSARKFAAFLGYKDYKTFFASAINRAQQVCMSLEIDLGEHFKQETIIDNQGREVKDIRLSRFACYLAAMNGDPKKPEVAQAQAYFATFADACRRYIQETEQIERILIRDEISDHEKSLSSTARHAGVVEYQFFQNAGYRGLYNMNLSALRQLKRVPTGRSMLDFMGKDELAANLFRITQTEAKIKREGIHGQNMLEKTAEDVGRAVRKTMHQISGQRPEDLLPAEDIKKVKSGLRATGAGLQRIDKKKLKSPKKEG